MVQRLWYKCGRCHRRTHDYKRLKSVVNMRTNAYISYKIANLTARFDSSGFPIAGENEWSEKIPCSLSTNSDNRVHKYDYGLHRVSTYTILTETCDFPLTATVVHLHRGCECLGEFKVVSVEPLETVGRIKIVVSNG